MMLTFQNNYELVLVKKNAKAIVAIYYSIVKDSNVDLTVGNSNSKQDPYIISNSSGLA